MMYPLSPFKEIKLFPWHLLLRWKCLPKATTVYSWIFPSLCDEVTWLLIMHRFWCNLRPYFVGAYECCNNCHVMTFGPSFKDGFIRLMSNPTIHSSTTTLCVPIDYIATPSKIISHNVKSPNGFNLFKIKLKFSSWGIT